jgi:hypothetical protein
MNPQQVLLSQSVTESVPSLPRVGPVRGLQLLHRRRRTPDSLAGLAAFGADRLADRLDSLEQLVRMRPHSVSASTAVGLALRRAASCCPAIASSGAVSVESNVEAAEKSLENRADT